MPEIIRCQTTCLQTDGLSFPGNGLLFDLSPTSHSARLSISVSNTRTPSNSFHSLHKSSSFHNQKHCLRLTSDLTGATSVVFSIHSSESLSTQISPPTQECLISQSLRKKAPAYQASMSWSTWSMLLTIKRSATKQNKVLHTIRKFKLTPL